jgi:peptide/nickel transport system substrate-binding protein
MMVRLIALVSAVLMSASMASAQTETPRRGGTLIYAVSLGEPDSFDCHASISGSVLYRIAPHYSTLVKIDQHHYPNVVGDTAQSWTISPDGLTYTFKLIPNIRFHDGSPFSAADVKATFDRIRKPPEGVISARQALYRDITDIETPDAGTVVFKLAKPNAAMLAFIASPWNCLYSAKKLAEDPNFPRRNVLGTGPFKFVDYVAGSEWKGERFDGYFRTGKPYLDGYRAISVAGPAVANALVAGQVATDFRGVTLAERDRIVEARGDKVTTGDDEQPGMLMLTFNTQKKPFDDVRVRQAFNLAIDRWGGSAALARQTIFSGVNAFQRTGSTYARSKEELQKLPGFRPDMEKNRAEARRLLAEAGQSNLANVTFLNRVGPFTNLGVFLVDQWRQIGVTVAHDQAENQRFFASRSGGTFDIIVDAIQDYIDEPSLQMSPFLSFDRNPTNISRAIDRTVDDLYEKQARTTDVAARKKIVSELEERLVNQAYTLPFFWPKRYSVMASEVRGFTMSPSSLVGQDLADFWLAR